MFENFGIIDWSVFHFLRPQFLWGFVVVGVLAFLGYFGIQEKVKWQKHIAPHLRPYMIDKGNRRTQLFMQVVLITGLSLGVLALSGPTWQKEEVPGRQLATPLVILLDLSQSMMANDIQPTRLERAKFKINDLLEADPGARVALVGFAGTAHTIVPLTRDKKILNSHIESLSPNVMPFRGSDLQRALTLADTIISVTEAPGTVLIFSDDFDDTSFDLLNDYVTSSENEVHILPMNTQTGSEVPAYGGSGALRDEGNVVYSSLNANVISRLEAVERVEVHRLTLDDSDIELIARDVRAGLVYDDEAEEKEDSWLDSGSLLVIPLMILFLLWFRKGWVVYSLLFAMTLTSCGEVQSFNDLWYTKDYQGQRLSDKGEFKEASASYEDPLRKGVALYKSGDYEQAILELSRDTTAMGAYDLGLAFIQNGDFESAQLAFGKAIELDPAMEAANSVREQLQGLIDAQNEVDPAQAKESAPEEQAENVENKDMEDLGGGGQEATEEDMQKERKEETVTTDVRKGKELDEVPDDIGATTQPLNSKVLLRKIDDDPALFLKKKFEFQVKEQKLKPKTNGKPW